MIVNNSICVVCVYKELKMHRNGNSANFFCVLTMAKTFEELSTPASNAIAVSDSC